MLTIWFLEEFQWILLLSNSLSLSNMRTCGQTILDHIHYPILQIHSFWSTKAPFYKQDSHKVIQLTNLDYKGQSMNWAVQNYQESWFLEKVILYYCVYRLNHKLNYHYVYIWASSVKGMAWAGLEQFRGCFSFLGWASYRQVTIPGKAHTV